MNCLTKDKFKYNRAMKFKRHANSQIETLNHYLTQHKSDCFDLMQKEVFNIDVHNEYMSNHFKKIKKLEDEIIEYTKIIKIV
jgi:predicted NAD-dependent protein-ADP-ribosyltransferase YbiA (DUF1768 family)